MNTKNKTNDIKESKVISRRKFMKTAAIGAGMTTAAMTINTISFAKTTSPGNTGLPRLSMDVREYRWRRTKELMQANKVDVLLAPDVHSREGYGSYLSYDNAEGMVIFPLKGDPVHLVWTFSRVRRHQENIRRGETPWIANTRGSSNSKNIIEVINDMGLQNARIAVVGVDTHAAGEAEGMFPYRTYDNLLKGLPGAAFVEVSEQFEEMMLIKNAEELEFVRISAQFAEQACEAMFDATKPGVTERDVYIAIMEVILSAGIPPTPHIILHGGKQNLSWGPPMYSYQGGTGKILEEGDIIMAEIFPRYAGFETQAQMAVALSPVPQILKDVAAAARASYKAGLAILKPGIDTEQLRSAMDKPVLDRGWTALTPYFHTMGPVLWASSSRPISNPKKIKKGMVFELEPNANTGRTNGVDYRVNIGGTVIVTETGAVEFNKLPTKMRIK